MRNPTAKARGPLNRTMPMPPTPGGVAIAAMVSSVYVFVESSVSVSSSVLISCMVSRVACTSHTAVNRELTEQMNPARVEALAMRSVRQAAMDVRNGGCMSEGQPLRFYANPLKFLLLLLASAIFVAIGIWMLHTPAIGAKSPNVVVAWLAIGFFGLGGVVLPYRFRS